MPHSLTKSYENQRFGLEETAFKIQTASISERVRQSVNKKSNREHCKSSKAKCGLQHADYSDDVVT
jgi:hypothetical protein